MKGQNPIEDAKENISKEAAFTKEQLLAVSHREGPMLVLAGPGSGKTTVITNRIRFLVERCGVHPGNILVITFTKAAADEMEERYRRNAGSNGIVNFGTFHAVFFKILRLAYHYDASNILSEEERFRIIRELVLSKLSQDFSDEKEMVETVSSEISNVKNEQLSISDYYSMSCPEESFREIYRAYEDNLKHNRKLDFDDMLSECYQLLTSRPDILALWQQKYQYVLIDEFQDINKVQYETICLLAAPQNNLFVVGDDDQSIYQFRGARPELMLRFAAEYQEASRVTLSCNFRSSKPIVDASARLIANNKKRFEKELYAKEEVGEPIERMSFPDRKKECQRIAEEIAVAHKLGLPYSEIAVLYRTNIQTRTIISMLMARNIPFRLRDSMPNLYEHWVSRNVISYIKLALGSRERGLFLDIMNRPKRYMSREALDTPQVDFVRLSTFYEDKDYVLDRLEKLQYDLSVLAKLTPFNAINYIRRTIGYDAFLSEYAIYRRIDMEDMTEVLTELSDDAAEFTDYESWFSHMEEVTEQLKLQKRYEKQRNENAVTLSTYHFAKGLEYHTVFLPELCEGLTPYKKAIKDDELEEERRMFYVAVTRAKRRLVLSTIRELRSKDMTQSRFLSELFLDQRSFEPSQRVVHSVYGAGTIISNSAGRLCIQFDSQKGQRVLNEAYCIQSGLLRSEE